VRAAARNHTIIEERGLRNCVQSTAIGNIRKKQDLFFFVVSVEKMFTEMQYMLLVQEKFTAQEFVLESMKKVQQIMRIAEDWSKNHALFAELKYLRKSVR
jgi:hypothetical protein